MNVAIVTRLLPATNYRGARIVATANASQYAPWPCRLVRPYDYAAGRPADDAADALAAQLAAAMTASGYTVALVRPARASLDRDSAVHVYAVERPEYSLT